MWCGGDLGIRAGEGSRGLKEGEEKVLEGDCLLSARLPGRPLCALSSHREGILPAGTWTLRIVYNILSGYNAQYAVFSYSFVFL